jgi:hypothetical protein
MQKFIGRLVGEKLSGRVNMYQGLVQFARTWADKAQQQNCEAGRLQMVYDDMIIQVRREAQSPGAWLTVSNSGMTSSSLSGGLRESPVSGNTAQLNEKGLAGVCASGKQSDVDLFVGRMIVQLEFHCADFKTLQQHTSGWAQRVREQNCVAAKVKPIYDEIESRLRNDARVPNSYVKDPKASSFGSQQGGSLGAPAAPLSGQKAELNAQGFAGAVATGKAQDVEAFVGRLIFDLGYKITPGKYSTLSQLAGQWANEVRQQNCVPQRITSIYDGMVSRIRGDSQMPGAWVQGKTPNTMSTAYAPVGQAPPLAPMTPMGQPPVSSLGRPPPLAPSGSPPLPPPPLAPLR